MTDINKIQGPSGSPDSTHKKSSSVDADRFQAEMRKRVEEVSPIDPDEQKKRKRPEEAEEEESLLASPEPTPPSQVPPFLLTQDSQPSGLLEAQPSNSSNQLSPASSPSSSETSSYSQEPSSSYFEEQTPIEPSSYSSTPSGDSAQSSTSSAEPSHPQTTPSSSSQDQLLKKQEEGLILPLDLEKKSESSVDRTALFEQMKSKESIPSKMKILPELRPQQIQPDAQIEAEEVVLPPSLEPFLGESVNEKSKTEALKATRMEGANSSNLSPSSLALPQAPESIFSVPPYARLSPQVQDLFDRMVGVITIMHLEGITETSFTLSAPQFASSVFFGAQIIIREFSTAPQAFNVELQGSTQAVSVFLANAGDLVAAFQAGNYTFRINRLEANYTSSSPPRVKRKDEEEADDQGQNKGDPHP